MYSPHQSELVCSKYSQDGEWYRAEVLDIYGDEYHLNLIDYGSLDVVGAESIRKVDHSLLKYKVIGVKCRLHNTDGLVDGACWDKDKLFLKVMSVYHIGIG